MNGRPVVVLDLETTGLSPYRHGITEIAAVKLQGGKVIDKFHTLVHPEQPVPTFITRLTGITNSMVQDAPTIREVLPRLHSFLEESIFVGHNVGFDHKFLDHYSKKHFSFGVQNDLLCTCKLARRLLPDLPSKKLGEVCNYFSIENTQAHRAMSDVLATTEVLSNLQKKTQLSIEQLLTLQKIARKQIPKYLEKIQDATPSQL